MLCMVRTKARKPGPPRHFLREWRVYRDLSLERVVEQLKILATERPAAAMSARIGFTHGNLSRIERFGVPYNQYLLELLAEIYKTDPGSLIMRDPSSEDAIWSIWDQIPPVERPHAADVLKTFVGKGRKVS